MMDIQSSSPLRAGLGPTLQEVREGWASLGIAFSCNPSPIRHSPEKLILESIPHIAGHARLFFLIATWINNYSDLINAREIESSFRKKLSITELPKLALLLETGVPEHDLARFQNVLDSIQPAASAQPLFDIMRKDSYLTGRARANSSEAGKRWNLWVDKFDFSSHMDAIRPRNWILQNNPGLGAQG